LKTVFQSIWRIMISDESGVVVRRGTENDNAALVALESGRRKVFWCDREASQPESLCARGVDFDAGD
jgi:hypothetical protein